MRRVCVLTGASGLLGQAFISRYADRYEIIAVYDQHAVRHPTQTQALVDPLQPTRRLAANDQPVHAVRADLSRPDSVDRLVRAASEVFGRVDLLINAAAVRQYSPLLAAGAADTAADLLSVNVVAPLKLALALAKAFWLADLDTNVRFNRNVVNVSSTAGIFVYPDLGQGLYAASKAALNHLTYHLATEFWDIGVRVNAVAPDTFPGRVPTADVLAALIACDESPETGQLMLIEHQQ
jgi:NAD(P)-dependent dehydrogenase (short-subunit alcohol dehydrogenase family)